MPGQIPAGEIHHLRLTVTDVQRSREFYTRLLGFQVAVESLPPGDPGADEAFGVLSGGVVMIRGNVMMGLRPVAPADDRFRPGPGGPGSSQLQRGHPRGPGGGGPAVR